MKSFNLGNIGGYILDILPYLGITYAMVLTSLAFGCLFGMLVAKGKLGKNKALKKICFGYTTVIRCVPTIVMLFLVYYGLPRVLGALGIDTSDFSKFTYVVITFILFSTSELSEVMRSSYEAVNKGQREAGVSIGLTEWQTFWRIIFPQALRIAVPNLGNTVILLFKEGSLAYMIGFIDIMGRANMLQTNSYGVHALEIYAAVSVIYWVCCIIFEQLIKTYERVVLNREKGAAHKRRKEVSSNAV